MVLSFEEPAGYDPDTDEEIPLGDMLAASDDDPAGAAARMMDWEDFLDTHNPPLRGVRVRSRTGQARQGYGRQVRVQQFVGARLEGKPGRGSAGALWRGRHRGLHAGALVARQHHGGPRKGSVPGRSAKGLRAMSAHRNGVRVRAVTHGRKMPA